MNNKYLTPKGQESKAVLLAQDAHSSVSSGRQSPARILMDRPTVTYRKWLATMNVQFM
jgi:hypothetical protein